MNRYFLNKTWGFDPSTHPILSFNTKVRQRKFLNASDENDWVIIAGTQTHNTVPHQRGRLLGKVKLGRHEIQSMDIFKQIGTVLTEAELDDNQEYKWPEALPMLEAYAFDDAPLVRDIFNDGLPGQVWAQESRLVQEGDNVPDDIDAILDALPCTKVEIHPIDEFEEIRNRQAGFSATKRVGPPPSKGRSASEVSDGEPVTYLLELTSNKASFGNKGITGPNGKKIFKVGYTNDIDRRLKEINKHCFPSLTGIEWKAVNVQPHLNRLAAYTCEQLIIQKLLKLDLVNDGEAYEVPADDIKSIFNEVLFEAKYMDKAEQSKFESFIEAS